MAVYFKLFGSYSVLDLATVAVYLCSKKSEIQLIICVFFVIWHCNSLFKVITYLTTNQG